MKDLIIRFSPGKLLSKNGSNRTIKQIIKLTTRAVTGFLIFRLVNRDRP